MNKYLNKETKPWGYELILAPEGAGIMAKILHVNQGQRCSLQYHEQKEEVLVLTNGRAKIIYGSDRNNLSEEEMEKDKGYLITPGLIHRFQAITDCDIFESSTPEKGTTFRLEDDYQRTDETEEIGKKERAENLSAKNEQ